MVSNSTFCGNCCADRILIMDLSTSIEVKYSAGAARYRSAANISENNKAPTKTKYLMIGMNSRTCRPIVGTFSSTGKTGNRSFSICL